MVWDGAPFPHEPHHVHEPHKFGHEHASRPEFCAQHVKTGMDCDKHDELARIFKIQNKKRREANKGLRCCWR